MKHPGSKNILPALGVGLAALALVAGAAGALHLLNSHAMEAPRQPAVTADSLGGTDLAQNALAAAAGDGKNYPYVYPRGDIETAVEDTRQALENAIKGTLMSADHYREQGDTEQAERLEQQARQSREALETDLADARRQLEREAELAKDAIPAQEAANIAGVWMEQAYGMEIGDTPLQLSLDYRGEKPTAWIVNCDRKEDAAHNMVSARAYVFIDALTGSVLIARYDPEEEQIEAQRAHPLLQGAAIRENGDIDLSGLSEDALASYLAEARQIVGLDAVSGVEGGVGWTVEMDVDTNYSSHSLKARIRYANGKPGLLTRRFPQGKDEAYPARLWFYVSDESVFESIMGVKSLA